MNDSIAVVPESAVFFREEQPMTSSRMVAEVFGKQHAHVLRDVQNLVGGLSKFGSTSPNENKQNLVGDPHDFVPVSQSKFGLADAPLSSSVTEFSAHNFVLAKYIDEQGKPRPEYLMTKDGFMFLVMGYTGEKAMQTERRTAA